ncbi:SH3 domain-containing protein [bacterium]|nr:SH3 domain-containing protein [bacterium]
MKNQVRVFLFIAVVFGCFSTVIISDKIDPETQFVIPETGDALYNRAPDPLPWILPEMLDPAYWTARMKNPDEVILTPDKIEIMNAVYKRFITSPDPFRDVPPERRPVLIQWWPGFSISVPNIGSLSPQAVADTVRNRLQAETAYLRQQEYGNALAIRYSAEEIDAFEREISLDTAKDTVTVHHGIAVRTARLRNIPSFFPQQTGLTQSRKERWDLWNIGVIKIGMPVQILHVSKSGEYLFVLCEAGYGWTRSDDIAFCTVKEIDEFVNAPDFIVATNDRVQFYTDESCTYASGWFGLGTRLPLVSGANPRLVKVPVRKMNGKFATETAWIADTGDVHVGLVPYTRRNIVTIAFRLLGTPYDWSGAWFGRQHETIYRDIFACFGFVLPCHNALFTFYNNNNATVLLPDMGAEKYYEKMNENEPFVTLQSCGDHCQLYLGEYRGKPIVFDQHGYGYPDEKGVWWEVRRCTVGDMRLPRNFLREKVTFLELM